MMPTILELVVRTSGVNVRQYAVLRLMDMDYMIWPATFGNGVRTGMERTIIVVHQLRIRQGRAQAHPGCCGAGLGPTLLTTCG